ncbi:MAG: hypothetical protein B5M53_00445 [Candidatus Cloacimonas sp. 4484_209]|nr:MAG: hypothetical protein B5M53_00445 [Candidatus Cloacimonas sp. 4484_209]
MNIAFITNLKKGIPVYWSMNKLYTELKEHKLNPILINIDNIIVGYRESLNYLIKNERIDLCLYENMTNVSTGKLILKHFESMKIPTINTSNAVEISSNKYLTYLELIKNEIPVPKMFLATSYKTAQKIIENFEFPIVAKTIYGSGGRGLKLIKSGNEAETYFKNAYYPVLIQEFIKKDRDIRVFVIDNKAVLGIYRYSKFWIKNVDTGARIEKIEEMPKKLEALAIASAKAIGLQVSGIDILEKDKSYMVSETNSIPGFRKIYEKTGIKIEKLIVEYITKKYGDADGLR